MEEVKSVEVSTAPERKELANSGLSGRRPCPGVYLLYLAPIGEGSIRTRPLKSMVRY